MGDAVEQVAMYLQRAAPDGGVVARQAIGAGFGTLTRAELGGARMAMRYDPAAKGWRAIFVRPLAAAGQDLRRGLVPFSVAVWEGARSERGGNKSLTRWKFLRLADFPLDPAYVAEMSWGYAKGDLGSSAKGKELVEAQCTACHPIGANRLAAPGIAPDLSTIGVIATPAYLRDSIVNASAVLVPSPNPWQHQDRSRKDARGSWPPDEAYVWYAEKDGRRSSSMPDFDAFSKDEVADIVAYLVTLGEEPPGGRSQP
jgi:complex iron-sulfur molybdoenzyme family reductase subunit gamma